MPAPPPASPLSSRLTSALSCAPSSPPSPAPSCAAWLRAPALSLALLLLGACASPARHPALHATAWAQTSAEARALATQVWAGARAHLDEALRDPRASALPGVPPAAGAPPAVIVDVDETVLDNTPWQVRSIRDGTSYPAGWLAWCEEARAAAVPGALAFARHAAGRGVTIFYVSNRDASLEAATRQNLRALGFPLAPDVDTVLLKGERETWTSDKTSRRAHVARDFRVVLLAGDNLSDFVAIEERDAAARARAVDAHAALWGTRWFMLPNPIYGSWEGALLGETDAAGDARLQRLLEALDTADFPGTPPVPRP